MSTNTKVLTPEEKLANQKRRQELAETKKKQERNRRIMSFVPWILLGLGIIAILLWHPWQCNVCGDNVIPVVTETPTAEPKSSTEVPVVQPTEVPVVQPTEVPVVQPTEVPVVQPTEVPSVIVCGTPSIRGDVDDSTGGFEKGIYLETSLGKRVTFTSRSLIVPGKTFNEGLTAIELKAVEDTWQYVVLCIPDGMSATLFAGGLAQGSVRYDNGVLVTLTPGRYSFQMRNGEIVVWYPNQQKYSDADLLRIIDQLKHGNFDIHSQLMLFSVTADLVPQLPAEFKVQTIPGLTAE